MLQTTSERVLEARGQTRFLAIGQMVKLAALPGLLLAGYRFGGVVGMIFGLAVAELGRYLLISWFVHRQGLPVFLCDLRLTVFLALLSVTAYLVERSWFGDMPKWGRLAAESITICLLWLVIVGCSLYRNRLGIRALLPRANPGTVAAA
jgi:hypothetical protein